MGIMRADTAFLGSGPGHLLRLQSLLQSHGPEAAWKLCGLR